jgi:hypothetical protein
MLSRRETRIILRIAGRTPSRTGLKQSSPAPAGKSYLATTVATTVLIDVALEVNLSTFRQETLAALATTVLQDATTCLCRHTGTETMLLLANSLGRLVGTLTHQSEKLIEIPLRAAGPEKLAIRDQLSIHHIHILSSFLQNPLFPLPRRENSPFSPTTDGLIIMTLK